MRIEVSGRVQNVFFRHTAQKIAKALGLTGWVKNAPDGSVLCEVQGERIMTEQFVSFAIRGPRLAEVKKVMLEYIDLDSEEKRFEIIA